MTTVPTKTPLNPPITSPAEDPPGVVQIPGDPIPEPLGKPLDTEPKSENQGEGDVRAARRYNEATREYVRTHDVEQAAIDAEPRSEEEAEELERAEDVGRDRTRIGKSGG